MIQRPRRTARDPFHHPDQDEVSYEMMLEAMAMCRREVQAFRAQCGARNPAFREAQALVEQIDAVARLSRVAGAEQIVSKDEVSKQVGH
ncbi:MAG: hypothetical protein JXQ99_00385 [Hyphomicrobiaceae bacterium]